MNVIISYTEIFLLTLFSNRNYKQMTLQKEGEKYSVVSSKPGSSGASWV